MCFLTVHKFILQIRLHIVNFSTLQTKCVRHEKSVIKIVVEYDLSDNDGYIGQMN